MKMKTVRPNRRKARVVIAGTAAVLALAGAVLFAVNAMNPVDGNPRASHIPAHAPANADTLVVAPYTGSWWSKLSAMAPQQLSLDGLAPDKDLKITNIGYSRSPDATTRAMPGPLRVFYIEAPDDTEAARVASWLKAAPGYDSRTVSLEGDVLVVNQPWVGDYKSPDQTMASVAGYKPAVTDKQASMYFNPQQEITSLAGQGDGTNAKAMGAFLEKGMGFSTDTAWSGTSKDGDSWTGTFTAGGVDPAKIDFSQATSTLMATRKVVAEKTNTPSPEENPDQNLKTSYQVLEPGLSEILSTSTFSAPGKNQALGGKSLPTDIPTVKDAAVTGIVDINRWDRAVTGNPSVSESVLSRSMSANEHEMVMSFVYAQPQK